MSNPINADKWIKDKIQCMKDIHKTPQDAALKHVALVLRVATDDNVDDETKWRLITASDEAWHVAVWHKGENKRLMNTIASFLDKGAL